MFSDANNKMLLIARVTLGSVYLCEANQAAFSRAPCGTCNNDKCTIPDHELHDSVLGVGDPSSRLQYREFVFFDREFCYPEYIVQLG